MADTKLQILAELIDRTGPGQRKIQKALTDLGNASAKQLPESFKKYSTAISNQERALAQFSKRSEGIRREVEAFKSLAAKTAPTIYNLTSSLGTFASGGGAMVGAIGAVGAALVEAGKYAADFAESMRQIKFGSAETGLGKLQLKQIVQALAAFDISAEQVSQGFVGLRRAMTEMTAHTGKFKETFESLGGEVFKYVTPVIEEAKKAGTTTAKVYAVITQQLDRISADQPDKATAMDLRRRYLQRFGFSPEFARAGEAAVNAELEVVKKLGTRSDEMKAAVEAADEFNKLMDDDRIILDKWLTNLNTSIIKVLLYIDSTMDRIAQALGFSKLKQYGILFAPITGGASASVTAGIAAWARAHGIEGFAEGGTVTKPTTALVGEGGGEFVMPHYLGRSRFYNRPTVTTLGQHGAETVIPARASAFIRAIGRTETDFDRAEAYSDKLNQASNNAYVRKFGQAGADYGYFQNSQRDVADAIRLGVPPEIAGHLAGGSQSTFAPAGDVSTLAQQSSAMNEYLKVAAAYQKLVAGGSFEDMRRATVPPAGQWFGLRNRAKAQAEFNTSLAARTNLNATMAGGFEQDGQLDVHVRAPQGTSVKAEGGGIFQRTNLRRSIQMQPSSGGPPQ